MDIVLGVSMTPTSVRMVLIEGEEADGLTVDNDVFDISAVDGALTSSASEQVSSAVLGTQESAAASGHHLVATGVTWSDDAEAAALRECLVARGLEGVTVVSELHAAGALAQAVGQALGYDTTALMLIEPDTATLSVVETTDGSIEKVLSQSLPSSDTTAVLTEMVTSLEHRESLPQGLFVVGSGVDITSVKSHLETVVSLPVSAPEDPEQALARGAALASANAPRFEATTVGLAYSQDPDGTTAGTTGPLALADVPTQLGPVGEADADAADGAEESNDAPEGRKLFLPVFSVLTAFLVLGVVALVISLAVSIRPTVDQRPSPGEKAIAPSAAAPAPPAVQEAAPAQNPPAVREAQPALVQPAPEIIPDPVSVAQPAPRTVVVEAPAVNAQAPVPAPQRRAPAAAPVAHAPVAIDPPVAHAPVAIDPPVAQAGCHRPPVARAGCHRPAGGTDPSATGSGGNAPGGYSNASASSQTAAAAHGGPDLPRSGAEPVGAAFAVAPAASPTGAAEPVAANFAVAPATKPAAADAARAATNLAWAANLNIAAAKPAAAAVSAVAADAAVSATSAEPVRPATSADAAVSATSAEPVRPAVAGAAAVTVRLWGWRILRFRVRQPGWRQPCGW